MRRDLLKKRNSLRSKNAKKLFERLMKIVGPIEKLEKIASFKLEMFLISAQKISRFYADSALSGLPLKEVSDTVLAISMMPELFKCFGLENEATRFQNSIRSLKNSDGTQDNPIWGAGHVKH